MCSVILYTPAFVLSVEVPTTRDLNYRYSPSTLCQGFIRSQHLGFGTSVCSTLLQARWKSWLSNVLSLLPPHPPVLNLGHPSTLTNSEILYYPLPYRVFSLTWPGSMQIYWNKRKRLLEKRVQLPEDWFGTPTWPPWRHVKTLYIANPPHHSPPHILW